MRRTLLAVSAALLLIVGLPPAAATGAGPDPSGTFVTVANPAPTRAVVQLRSTDGGRVLRSFSIRDPGTVSAAETPGGDILVASSSTCSATVDTIDAADDRTTASLHVDESVAMLAPSPGGRYLAYVTYGPCATPEDTARPAQTAGLLPDVLAVRDLATGRTVSAATPNPGDPWWSVSWSPGGRRLVAGYQGGDEQQLMVLDPSHPVYSLGDRIRPPRGCGLLAGSWRAAGIVAALECHPDSSLDPKALVLVSSSGRVLRSTPLPRCIDGFSTQTDPGERATIIEANTGYGHCDATHDNEFAELGHSGLQRIADLGVDVNLG